MLIRGDFSKRAKDISSLNKTLKKDKKYKRKIRKLYNWRKK